MNVGGVAAAFNKHGEDAVSAVLVMLKQLAHRGADVIQVATPTSTVTGKSFSELQTKNLVSNTALGHNSSPMPSKQQHESVLQKEDFTLVFEGNVFPAAKTDDIDEVASCLKPNFKRNAQKIIRRFDGSYAFAITSQDCILVGRDQFGTTPLFYGEDNTLCAVASERKALWTLGIKNVGSFPPGSIAVLNIEGFKFKSVATVTQPPQKSMGMGKAASRLQKLLLKSTAERALDLDEVAVSFSGGLDSAVLAVLAKTCVRKVSLVTVGLKGQPELTQAQKAADSIKLPLHIKEHSEADVESVVERVLWLIEEPDVMKLGVAIPLFWAAESASRIGCRVLLAGQGADELFGGYHRYLTEYRRGGVRAVQSSLLHDVAMSYETNFQRDNAACAFHNVELRLPYIDREVVSFALSLPVSLKSSSMDDPLRKRVLRQVARNLGIPAFVAERTKKAVQYATGVDMALRRIAKRRGLTQRDFVKQSFEKVYPTLEG